MSLLDLPLAKLDGTPSTLRDLTGGNVTLLVNVASQCGLTGQYAGLEKLQETYRDRGFTVVGVPCNQFMGQEPGTPEEIQAFCTSMYGVSFPLTEKIEVNGDGRHAAYAELTQHANTDGKTGDIEWNFEKFLLDRDGTVVARFAPGVEPEDPQVVSRIESTLG